MKLRWLGTAGFEIQTGKDCLLLDPFLTRNKDARPVQSLIPDNFNHISRIFISHGHFDHLMDVPQIAAISGCEVFCSPTAGKTIEKHQTPAKQIRTIQKDRQTFNFQDYSAQVFFSRHIRFDIKLILATLSRVNPGLIRAIPSIACFPCGQVLSWRFFIENKTIHFFGSAGSDKKELGRISKGPPVDVLLLAFQGHSDIHDIAVNYVLHLKPKTVIIHHHDNFYPPVSRSIDTRPFIQTLKKICPQTRVIVPRINEFLCF